MQIYNNFLRIPNPDFCHFAPFVKIFRIFFAGFDDFLNKCRIALKINDIYAILVYYCIFCKRKSEIFFKKSGEKIWRIKNKVLLLH
jgi:hypothetical protein